jgi:hypothetical protein
MRRLFPSARCGEGGDGPPGPERTYVRRYIFSVFGSDARPSAAAHDLRKPLSTSGLRGAAGPQDFSGWDGPLHPYAMERILSNMTE